MAKEISKQTIKAAALEAEKGRMPECTNAPAFRGVNSAYGMGFVDGVLWAMRFLNNE